MIMDKDMSMLEPCPICGLTKYLYMGHHSDAFHITCTHCEIDTWSRLTEIELIHHWNTLPRGDK